MKLVKDFAFGALYLVSGIYSVGFSMALTGATKALSGRTAFVPVPDGLFPYEVLLFGLFGVVFLGASLYHFRMGFRSVSTGTAEYSSRLPVN
ncbi:MAG: hypothetical protein OK438_00525 [Thaumarchaeota archaeon]|nr:hypothetical protein [Nitrososphaerota archaeon]